MSDRFFLDTNIFVYSFDQVAVRKAEQADRLIGEALTLMAQSAYQVVQEFFSVAHRRRSDAPKQAERPFAVLRPLGDPLFTPSRRFQILEHSACSGMTP